MATDVIADSLPMLHIEGRTKIVTISKDICKLQSRAQSIESLVKRLEVPCAGLDGSGSPITGDMKELADCICRDVSSIVSGVHSLLTSQEEELEALHVRAKLVLKQTAISSDRSRRVARASALARESRGFTSSHTDAVVKPHQQQPVLAHQYKEHSHKGPAAGAATSSSSISSPGSLTRESLLDFICKLDEVL